VVSLVPLPPMSLADHFQQIRLYTESLCSPLSIEDYLPQLVDYTSPPKWHLAHTTWFFEEMILKKYSDDYQEFDRDFCFLFNSYYNHVGDRLARSSRGDISKPDVEQIYAYRRYVNDAMQALMDKDVSQEVMNLIVLGINHEQQHQELLITDLKYSLGHNPLFPAYEKNANFLDDKNSEKGTITLPEGLYDVGYSEQGFHFDNECQAHKVYLNEFTINKSLVTNAEYIEFIEDGGYDKFEHWLDDGWAWKNQNNVTSPLYWHAEGHNIDGGWHYYTLAGLKPVNPDAMLAHISFYEASAFASWKGMRLPTEFEWEAASSQLTWGKRWEWTNSAYLPYPGFSISKDAVGEYNGKFMVNQMVLRGASVATSEGHSRSTYRNFFHPHLQWQYSGIRLAW